jgi:ribosome-associated protein
VDQEIVSKTRRKREIHKLQTLNTALTRLSESQLESIELPEELREALLEAKRITSHEAKRRQMQYVGRLMRGLDPEPIRARLGEIEGSSARATAHHRRLESWRERLLATTKRSPSSPPSIRAQTGAAHAHPQRAQGSGRGKAAARLPRTLQGTERD